MTDLQAAKAAFIESVEQPDHPFSATLEFIEQEFNFVASAFTNGEVRNESDQNQGSCKVLAMAKLLELSSEQALKCFGEHYRDVVDTPDGDSHQNIRQLQQHGLAGVTFDSFPLTAKQEA